MIISQIQITSFKETEACLSWVRNHDRYHIWFDPRTSKNDGTLYKRKGVSLSDKVKRLPVGTKIARQMIADALLACDRYDMLAKARLDAAAKDRVELERRIRGTRRQVLEKHGPELWDVLLLADEVLRRAPVNGKGAATTAIVAVKEKVRAALDEATKALDALPETSL